jgi:hypothetical protein
VLCVRGKLPQQVAGEFVTLAAVIMTTFNTAFCHAAGAMPNVSFVWLAGFAVHFLTPVTGGTINAAIG